MRWMPLVAGVALLFAGCAGQPPAERPMRSPTKDYPAEPARTSDGRVVGADGVAPADKLEEGVSSEGPAPGWKVEEGEPSYDPDDRVGGATDHDEKADTDEGSE